VFVVRISVFLSTLMMILVSFPKYLKTENFVVGFLQLALICLCFELCSCSNYYSYYVARVLCIAVPILS
jgi:putative effector of murein hydrolase